jgi:hypothetical protein
VNDVFRTLCLASTRVASDDDGLILSLVLVKEIDEHVAICCVGDLIEMRRKMSQIP